MKFLEWKYEQVLADCDSELENVLTVILNGLVAINKFMRSVYAQPLWVRPEVSGQMARQGMIFMRSFNSAAAHALSLGRPRFKFMHIFHSLQKNASDGVLGLNILAFSCQMDEDFIGRVAGQSRNVSIRTVHDRTVQRYLLNLALRW